MRIRICESDMSIEHFSWYLQIFRNLCHLNWSDPGLNGSDVVGNLYRAQLRFSKQFAIECFDRQSNQYISFVSLIWCRFGKTLVVPKHSFLFIYNYAETASLTTGIQNHVEVNKGPMLGNKARVA